jgi:hypothetical protein
MGGKVLRCCLPTFTSNGLDCADLYLNSHERVLRVIYYKTSYVYLHKIDGFEIEA